MISICAPSRMLITGKRADISEALDLLGQAIERDPHYGPALALGGDLPSAARSQRLDKRPGVKPPQGHRSRPAGASGRQRRPGVLGSAAYALAYFGEDIDAAIGLIDRALALNPSFARGWYVERLAQAVGRATRSRDRAFRDIVAPQPA